MDTTSLKDKDVLIQVRDKLQKDGVKLWLLPYYDQSKGPSEEDLERLALDYAKSLSLQKEECHTALSEWQTRAIEKLKQRDKYKECGLATLKVKILRQNDSPLVFSKETKLTLTGLEFKQGLLEELSTPLERCKLISGGVIIKEKETLVDQGIKNGSQIMAITLSESLTDIQESENKAKEIELTKADTSLLASDDHYMELQDQHGRIINIPSNEKKALMVAMALQEKGKSALKKEDYAKALLFFLDADKEFSQCTADILNYVDNFALLDLDIAWCYLCLESFVQLPEAQMRLNRCERRFHQTYGANLERVIAVKGSTGSEAALYARLHLLQGIVLYYDNKRQEAKQMLNRAASELTSLKVDETSLHTLIELGHSPAEARLGLRATSGDINGAANYLNDVKQEKNKAAAQRILQREQKKLGLCADGKQYVHPNFLKMLVDMGFSREAGRVALQKCNNVISESIEYMQNNPLPGPSNTKSQEFMSWIEDLIPELEAAGFDYEMAKKALQKNDGDIMKAAEELLANDSRSDTSIDEETPEKNDVVKGISKSKKTNKEKKSGKKSKEIIEELKRKTDAFARLQEAMTTEDDEHLDLTLEKEEVFLNEYLSLLKND